MNEKLKRLWLRRPKLSRGKKILVNLTLIALLLFWYWGLVGYPLPLNTWNFRRLERINLMPPSEIVLNSKAQTSWDQGEDLSVSTARNTVIGVTETQVISAMGYSGGDWYLDVYPRQEGVSVIPDGENVIYAWLSGEGRFRTVMFLVDVPENAVDGTLTLDLEYREQSYHRDCPLVDMGNGVWAVVVDPPDTAWSSDWCEGGAYVLTMYDAQGKPVVEQTGTVPSAL